MNCLWCDQEQVIEINWNHLIFLPKPQQLCGKCQQGLENLHGQQCQICSRVTRKRVCDGCERWEKANGKDPLQANISVYAYNKQMKEMIAKWKYRGDYVLANSFKTAFVETFNKRFPKAKKEMIAIAIPLSDERLYERGFNQAQTLADFLPINQAACLTRVHREKQSKKTRDERMNSENPFMIHKKINKPVILVDDIYTTGTTLRQAATLLLQTGCPKVYGYTLVRG